MLKIWEIIEILKKIRTKGKRLTEANNQTKTLENKNDNITKILYNLKSIKLNKNNMLISSKNVQKLKNYTEDVKKTTLINFEKYKIVMFVMDKLMEMESTEQNKVALYLFNNVKI